MTQDRLAELVNHLPGCEVALFADIAAGTCLRAASAIETGHEVYVGLCEEAVELLAGSATNPEVYCIRSGPMGHRMFVRRSVDHEEALCLLLSPTAPLENARGAAVDVLASEFREARRA